MNRLFLILLISAFVTSLTAQPIQQTKGMQFGILDADMIDRMMPTVEGVGGNTREMLLRQSVKAYMMPIRKTGANSNDVSYAVASLLEYYVNLDKNYKVNLSPDYISLNLRSAGRGMNIPEAFRFLSEDGTVSAAILPYDAESLTSGVYATQKYKIGNFLHLFRDVTNDRQRVFETRKALMRGHPVLVELQSDPSIRALAGERRYSPGGSASQKYPMIVVGYDEEQEAFELRSCWGRNWADGGYVWVSFDDFGKYAVNGFVLVP